MFGQLAQLQDTVVPVFETLLSKKTNSLPAAAFSRKFVQQSFHKLVFSCSLGW